MRDPVQPHHPPGRQVLHARGRHGSAESPLAPRSAAAAAAATRPRTRARPGPAQVPAPPQLRPALCASAFLQGVRSKNSFVIWDLSWPRRKKVEGVKTAPKRS